MLLYENALEIDLIYEINKIIYDLQIISFNSFAEGFFPWKRKKSILNFQHNHLQQYLKGEQFIIASYCFHTTIITNHMIFLRIFF